MTGSTATGARQGADAVVVAAGSSRRMGGVDKLAALVGGRPLLAWSVAAIAASSRVERVVLVVAPDRVAGRCRGRLAAARLRGRRRRVDAPGLRRGRGPPPRSRGPGGRRPPGAGPRRGAPAGLDGARRGGDRRRDRPRGGHPRAAGRRDAQARGRRPHRRDRRTRRARRRADAPGGAPAPAAGRLEPVPAGPPARFHRRGRPAGGLYHLGPCNSRRTSEPQGDAPRRPVAGRARADGARHPARRVRPRQPPVRSGLPAAARRRVDPRRTGARRSLGRRRRPPRRRRRAARCRRDGRPRAPLPERPPDAARRGQLAAAAGGRRATGSVRPAADVDRRDGHRRAAPLREPARRDALGDRGDGRARRGPGQRQGLDREPRPATRVRDARSRPVRWRRSRARHDDRPPGHAHRRGPAARPDRARPRRRLQLRPDGLRPGPHRELPLVPVRGPARALPALERPRGDLGHEPDRHRRQDHPRRGGRGDLDDRARRPLRRPRSSPTRRCWA